MLLPVAQVGDLAVVYQPRADGASASPAAFLGHPPAAEVLVRAQPAPPRSPCDG